MKPRLRQIALVARDLEPAAEALRRQLGLGEPYADPGVAVFGLRNAVMALGDTFIEVVSPDVEDTAAGRQLERLGGDGPYMAIFQVEDLAAARSRVVTDLGIRIAWEVELEDMGTLHLHPRDVPGALVSLDWASPAESWRWGGGEWIGGAPAEPGPGRILGVTVQAPDPEATAARWAAVLDAQRVGTTIELADGGFAAFEEGEAARITSVTVEVPEHVRAGRNEVKVCGVRFLLEEAV
jgi:hypothetical protein